MFPNALQSRRTQNDAQLSKLNLYERQIRKKIKYTSLDSNIDYMGKTPSFLPVANTTFYETNEAFMNMNKVRSLGMRCP